MATTAFSGQIVTLQGVAHAIDAQGHVRALKVGDTLRPDEQLQLDSSAALTLRQDDGSTITLFGDQGRVGAPARADAVAHDGATLAAPAEQNANDNAIIQQVLSNMAQGQDPTAQLAPAGAGLAAGGNGAENQYHTFVTLPGNSLDQLGAVNGAGLAGLDNGGQLPDNGLTTTPATAPAPISISIAGIALTNNTEPTLSGTGEPGLTVVVTNSAGTVLGATTVAGDGTWHLTPTVPLAQGSNTLTATSTNATGQTAHASATVTVDSIPPDTPAVSITDHHGEIGANDETNGKVQVQVAFDGTVQAGDVITLTSGGITLTHTVLASDLTAGHVAFNVTAPPNGQTMTVSATITDLAGNVSGPGSASALVVLTPPDTPAVTIVDHNGEIGPANENNGQVQVLVALDSSVKAGDILTLTSTTGAPVSYTVRAADLTAGHVGFSVAAPPDGQTLTVTATVADAAGNISSPGSASALVNLSVPNTPTVSIADHNGLIGQSDERNGQVQVQVALDGSVHAGDTLTLTSSNGSPINYTVQAADLAAGHVTLGVTAPPDGQTLTVSATITNAAGTPSGAGSASALVDLTPPDTPVIGIADHGGTISTPDEHNGQVAVVVALDGSVKAGDVLTVQSNTGLNLTHTVTAGDLQAGQVSLNVTAPPNGQSLTVTAALTDAAGNTSSTGTASALVNTTPPTTPTVTLVDHGGIISSPDEHNGQVQVQISLDGSVHAGDRLTLTTSTGGTVSYTVQAGDLTAGHASFNVAAPANGQTLTISATVTNQLGNVSQPGSGTGVVNTTPPTTPTVTIADHAGVISSPDEHNGQVQVQVSLDSSVHAGDTLTLTSSTGSPVNYTVQASDLAAGQATFNVAAPANGQTLTVSATVTNQLGNVSLPGGATAVVNTTPPDTPTLTLVDHNGIISAADEHNGQVQLQASLDSTVRAGDVLTVTSSSGDVFSHVITAAEIGAGLATVAVTAPLNGQTLTVSASLTDALGNQSQSGAASGVVNTTAPNLPDVSIVDHHGEIGLGNEHNGQVRVLVALDGSVVAGDVLTLASGNGAPVTYVVQAADIAAGEVIMQVAAPPSGQTLTVTATLTNALGNTSAPGVDSALVNTVPPNAPSVTIVDHNGAISAADEHNGQVVVQVALDNSVQAGDIVTLSASTGVPVSYAVQAADLVAGHIAFNVTAPANGQTLAVSATITDAAGNTSQPGAASALVETLPPNTPDVIILDHPGGIGSGDEHNGQVQVQVGLDGSVRAGDVVTLANSGGAPLSVTVQAADLTAGHVTFNVAAPATGQTLTVSATVTDAAGNVSTPAAASALVNTVAPDAPLLTIVDHGGTIGTPDEHNGLAQVNVGLDASVVAGDTLTLTSSAGGTIAHAVSATEILAGLVTVSVAAPASGGTLTVTGTLTDTAGNTSVTASTSAQVDTQAPHTPQVVIVDHNGVIQPSDAPNGHVTVQVALDASVQAGDTVTLTSNTGQPVSHVVTSGDLGAGLADFSVTAPANGAPLTVGATITDLYGNTSGNGSSTAVASLPPIGALAQHSALTLGEVLGPSAGGATTPAASHADLAQLGAMTLSDHALLQQMLGHDTLTVH